jgi:hypothetical protein
MKRIALTSRLAYAELQEELQPREREVLDALGRGLEAPTAYELLERMRAAHPQFDVNSIRPRLTSLRDKGRIFEGNKRRCRVTGRIAWTWTVASVVQPLPHSQPPANGHQARLDWEGSAR